MPEIRKYIVNYSVYGARTWEEKGTAHVKAFDAKDAVEQVRVSRQALMTMYPGSKVEITQVDPEAD